jgi:hypothetical protein
MTNLRNGACRKNVAKETVALARHGDQIAMLCPGDLQDFDGWTAHCQPD